MASFGDLNRVNTNIQSLDSQLSLNQVNKDMAENQLKMSTGKRINRAEDDSAGFSIATKLRGRIGGLNQAMQNVGDAKSVLDITESSYNTVTDNLVEMKGLATQGANDTLGTSERSYIGDQIQALGDDIDKIADQTVYQDYDLLGGSAGGGSGATLELNFQVGERTGDVITAEIEAIGTSELFENAGTNPSSMGGVTTAANYQDFITDVDAAISSMSDRVNDIGITQSSLSVREETLSESVSANESAKSRIMDTDFAKAQSESVRLSILQQTSTSSLAQANNGPQSVLGFIGQ